MSRIVSQGTRDAETSEIIDAEYRIIGSDEQALTPYQGEPHRKTARKQDAAAWLPRGMVTEKMDLVTHVHSRPQAVRKGEDKLYADLKTCAADPDHCGHMVDEKV